MTDKTARLKALSTKKLMDVVKNYRQYGYDDQLRNTALALLEGRGIDKEYLELTGNFENHTYGLAKEFYTAFIRNSKIAFILYGLLLVTLFLVPILTSLSQFPPLLQAIMLWGFVIAYVFFLVISFINQIQFFKAIGKDNGAEGALVFFLMGMPFYALLYFYFRRQMKEQMNMIE
ncbi:MAG: hypothetical protein JKY52_05520 [Flavobacteriales bacterium]|nr:hypothetical protein [Flavobacteriales bacterium]